jgi:outer membrane lipoprotein-sorting protein
MKKHSLILASAIICLGLAPAYSQFGPRGGTPAGPRLGGAMDKLFGDSQSFSATLTMQTKEKAGGDTMTMPGKITFDSGKSRFEVDMAQAGGGKMRPEQAEQMKSMGMDRMVIISRPDKKSSYLVYPGMQAYVENPLQDPETTTPASDYKVETTELGKETVDGHPCVKNKVVMTDKEGNQHESTVWNATDLKNFPVKIEQIVQGNETTMTFKDIALAKPAASLFDPPSDYTKYDSMPAMMQAVMMKRMGGGIGMPPH